MHLGSFFMRSFAQLFVSCIQVCESDFRNLHVSELLAVTTAYRTKPQNGRFLFPYIIVARTRYLYSISRFRVLWWFSNFLNTLTLTESQRDWALVLTFG